MTQPNFTAYDPKFASEALLPLYENAYRFEVERKDATERVNENETHVSFN